MEKLHFLSENDIENASLDKLKNILNELTDYTYKKICEIQQLKIETENFDGENLTPRDILITVFSNLISNTIGKALISSELDIKLRGEYFENISVSIYQGSNKFFKHLLKINSIDKKEVH